MPPSPAIIGGVVLVLCICIAVGIYFATKKGDSPAPAPVTAGSLQTSAPATSTTTPVAVPTPVAFNGSIVPIPVAQPGPQQPQQMVRWHFTAPGKILFSNGDQNALTALAKIKQAGRFTLSNVLNEPNRTPGAVPAGTFTYTGTEVFDANNTWVLYTPPTQFQQHSFATFSF